MKDNVQVHPHVMLDIETLGTAPGSVILAVAAVPFGGPSNGLEPFHKLVDPRSCAAAGMTVDQGTVDWWCARPEEQRRWIAGCRNAMPVEAVLAWLSIWWQDHAPGACAWACGPDFDLAHLAAAYRLCGMAPPWEFWRARDLRTLRDAAGHDARQPWMQAPTHNAFDDAARQAAEAEMLLHGLGLLND